MHLVNSRNDVYIILTVWFVSHSKYLLVCVFLKNKDLDLSLWKHIPNEYIGIHSACNVRTRTQKL